MTEAVGLCARCANARRIFSARGSTFWLCRKAADDPRFPKYPRLPVLRCPGFEDRTEAATTDRAPAPEGRE
jgi:hypothetical protein